jgi:hypothetical protein
MLGQMGVHEQDLVWLAARVRQIRGDRVVAGTGGSHPEARTDPEKSDALQAEQDLQFAAAHGRISEQVPEKGVGTATVDT